MLGPVRKGERQYMVRSQLESTYGGREVQKKKGAKEASSKYSEKLPKVSDAFPYPPSFMIDFQMLSSIPY